YETPVADALLCQLEIPVDTLAAAARSGPGFLAANLAPARAVPGALIARADLIIVNETEAAFYGEGLMREAKRVAVTYGARGAALFEGGAQIAFAAPPPVTAVDATGAGDAFCAALTLALLEGRPADDALRFACAVGALAATKPGAQPSFPSREDADAAAGAAA
ncbi:MAG: PfkB family carbohydrate kinase, partial [Pseudomonadota bacterium]